VNKEFVYITDYTVSLSKNKIGPENLYYVVFKKILPFCNKKENWRNDKHLHVSCQIPRWSYAMLYD
jgi:hypothetical protein